MIGRADIDDRVREWGLPEQVVEKDYVLGWLLWGIGRHPELRRSWAFKGGTCLKKCYIETYRFSEDLDFTVLPGGPLLPEEVKPMLREILIAVAEESGIDFAVREPYLRTRPDGRSVEGRVYYRGPRNDPSAGRVKLDLSAAELIVRPPVLRPIAHRYPDALPTSGDVRCYSFEELFAEKLRALGERGRPRDLYDVVNLFRRPGSRAHPDDIRSALQEKCRSKGVPVPTFASIAAAGSDELAAEWDNMLGHQLPELPPFESFWQELPSLFDWLEGRSVPEELERIPYGRDEDATWTPPETVRLWGTPFSLESVRFAGRNRLCVELGYQGTIRVIEPYSLRWTKAGNLLLYGIRVDNRQIRAYRVDRIQSVRVTTRPFQPVWAVQL